MKKLLLAGAAIAFAGIAATVAVASEHKSKPMHHASVVTAKTTVAHKESAPKKHHSPKRHHHAAPKAHTK